MDPKLKEARTNLRKAKQEYEEAEEVLFASGASWVLEIFSILLENLDTYMPEIEGMLTSPETRKTALEFYAYIKAKGYENTGELTGEVIADAVGSAFGPGGLGKIALASKPMLEAVPSVLDLSVLAKSCAVHLVEPIRQHLKTIDESLEHLFDDFVEKDVALKTAQENLYQVVLALD